MAKRSWQKLVDVPEVLRVILRPKSLWFLGGYRYLRSAGSEPKGFGGFGGSSPVKPEGKSLLPCQQKRVTIR